MSQATAQGLTRAARHTVVAAGGWCLGVSAALLEGCAEPPYVQVDRVEVVPTPTPTAYPVPDDSRGCTRHGDCVLAESVRIALVPSDCARPPSPAGAINRAALQRFAEATARLCGPPPDPCSCGTGRPPSCCPPVAVREPDEHAVCVHQRCALRPGPRWTEDEQREEAQGHGTLDEGECYLTVDCPAPPVTAFPHGLSDEQGRELCPVCPRPGRPVLEEASHIAALTPRCPQRSCLTDNVQCVHRRCVPQPLRADRAPAPAATLPPEPPAPPPEVALPSGPDYRCSSDRDCVLGPLARCSCGGREPVNRRAAEQRQRQHDVLCRAMPCARRVESASPAVPTCFEGVCADGSLLPALRTQRSARSRLLPAHEAWKRERAAIRLRQAAFDEIETAQ